MADTNDAAVATPGYTAQAHEIAVLLDALEVSMKAGSYWREMPPSSERLASTMPFCVDTLEITEWLQWIFLPRMRALLKARQALPLGCAIRPIAEEHLAADGPEARQVLALLGRIDLCLSPIPETRH